MPRGRKPKSLVPAKQLTIQLTEAMLLEHYSATELLQIATRALMQGKKTSMQGSSKADAPDHSKTVGNGRKKRKKRTMSEAGRAKIAAAARKRWIKAKKLGKTTL